MTHKMTHTDKLQLAFLVKSAVTYTPPETAGEVGSTLGGAALGGLGGIMGGKNLLEYSDRMLHDGVPATSISPHLHRANKTPFYINKDFQVSRLRPWARQLLNSLGPTKGGISRASAVFAMLAPLLGVGVGGDIALGTHRLMANKSKV